MLAVCFQRASNEKRTKLSTTVNIPEYDTNRPNNAVVTVARYESLYRA